MTVNHTRATPPMKPAGAHTAERAWTHKASVSRLRLHDRNMTGLRTMRRGSSLAKESSTGA